MEPEDLEAEANAEDLAYDNVAPDAAYVGLDVIDLYIAAFMAGVQFQRARAAKES